MLNRTSKQADQLPAPELSLIPGVYPDMFEQSILLDGGTSKRTAALFASASAQIIAVGVFLLIPLIYTETLPLARLPFTLPMPVSQPTQPPVENVKPASQTVRPNVFHMPFRLPVQTAALASPSLETQIDSAAPLPSSGPGAPLGDLGLRLSRIDRATEASAPAAASPKPIVAETSLSAQLVRVSSDLQAAKILKKVVPQYPTLARQARISGTVKLMGIIAKDGTVQKLQVISGHPLLQKAALDAVSQWRYQPTVLNGQPVEVIAPIDVIFTLSQ